MMTERKWKLVPVEPTEEMKVRGGSDFVECEGYPMPEQACASIVFETMLSAAPSPLEDEELVERVAKHLAKNNDTRLPLECLSDWAKTQYRRKARAVLAELAGGE